MERRARITQKKDPGIRRIDPGDPGIPRDPCLEFPRDQSLDFPKRKDQDIQMKKRWHEIIWNILVCLLLYLLHSGFLQCISQLTNITFHAIVLHTHATHIHTPN